jgi:hypothetical protein
MARAEHARLLTEVGAVDWYCRLASHVVSKAQVKAEVVVAPAVWYCAAVPGVRSAQARLDVDVAAAVSYWPPLHVLSAAQERLVVSVAAPVSYCVSSSHTVSAEHSRLLLAVPAAVWYSRAMHVAWLAQTRLDVDVAAVVSCCSAHSVRQAATRSTWHLLGSATWWCRCEPIGKGERTFSRNDGAPQASRRHWASRQGGKTPELRATSSNQSGVLSFLKETSVHPNRCKNCLMRLIENQCISVSLAASVLRLEMHAE